jgi:hypothetical protein
MGGVTVDGCGAWHRAAVAFSLVAFVMGCRARRSVDPAEERLAEGRVDHYVAAAKAKGKSSAFMACAYPNHREVVSMSDELDNDSVFVGRELGSAPQVMRDQTMIWTYYKFRIERDLSRSPIGEASADASLLRKEAPSSLLPVQANEILVGISGGQMNVDGVSVTYCDATPTFAEGQRYLLFVSLINDGKQTLRIGTIQSVRAEAVYNMLPDGEHFEAAQPTKSRFQTELMARSHGSLEELAGIAAALKQ